MRSWEKILVNIISYSSLDYWSLEEYEILLLCTSSIKYRIFSATSEKLHKYISFYFRIFTYFWEAYYWIRLSDDQLDYRYSFSVRIKVNKPPEIGPQFKIKKNLKN